MTNLYAKKDYIISIKSQKGQMLSVPLNNFLLSIYLEVKLKPYSKAHKQDAISIR